VSLHIHDAEGIDPGHARRNHRIRVVPHWPSSDERDGLIALDALQLCLHYRLLESGSDQGVIPFATQTPRLS
jgi:hypothetical protein